MNDSAVSPQAVPVESLVSRLKKMLSESATYSLALLAPRALSFVMVPIYTRYLSPADYGVLELLELTMGFVGMLLWMRFGHAVNYFYFAAETRAERERVQSTAFLWASGAAMLFGLGAWLAAPYLSALVFGTREYGKYFHIVAVTSGLAIPIEIGLTLIRAQTKSRLYSGLMVGRLILLAALNVILLVIFSMGVSSMLWSALTGAIALYLYLVWYVLSPVKIGFRKDLLFRMLRYAAPLGIGGLAMFSVHYGDRYVLRAHVSLAEIGIYSLAYKLGMLISLIHQPFNTYWNAQMYAIMAGPNSERLYVRVFTYLTLVLTYAAVLICLFARPFVILAAAPKFHPAAALVPLITLAYLVRGVAAHCANLFLIEKRPDLEARMSLSTAAVCIAGYFLLIPRFGVWGAVFATLIAFSFMLIFALIAAQRLRPFPLESLRLLQIAATGAVIVAVHRFSDGLGMGMQIALALALSLSYPAILLATGFMDREERDWMRGKLARLRAV